MKHEKTIHNIAYCIKSNELTTIEKVKLLFYIQYKYIQYCSKNVIQAKILVKDIYFNFDTNYFLKYVL